MTESQKNSLSPGDLLFIPDDTFKYVYRKFNGQTCMVMSTAFNEPHSASSHISVLASNGKLIGIFVDHLLKLEVI